MTDSNSRLVYSTETGRIDEPKAKAERPKGDGIVRIQRQTSGRKGKGVCLITGIDLDDAELAKLAAELKKKCGCGGAVKDGIIEIQGNKRDVIKSHLEAKGMKVKLAGGQKKKNTGFNVALVFYEGKANLKNDKNRDAHQGV